MNIVSKLTLRHLKENKGRTAITVLGVIISVAMITAVFVAIASFLNLFANISVLTEGDSVLQINNIDKKQVAILKSDDRIQTVGLSNMENINYRLENRKSDRLGTGSMLVSDNDNSKLIFTGKYDGEIPKNSKEIAVEQSFIDKNELDWKLGDTVTIPVGKRLVPNSTDEIHSGEYINGETFEVTSNRTFKITAIMHDNYATYQYCNIICGFDSGSEQFSMSDARIKLKELNSNSLNVIHDIVNEVGVSQDDCSINHEILDCHFAYNEGGTFASALPMIAIILVTIIVASVALIYNAFAMSLSERVRYLGMLASVGATKRQKRTSIYFEGIIFGLVGIPLGICAGIAGISITLKYIGNQMIIGGMIRGLHDDALEMKTVVPIWAIAAIIVCSVITILISSVIPAFKASKITPIDAIRQRQEIKANARRLRTPKIVRKIFGYEGELAHKNLKRNGRKSRVITVSIALSVVLFLSCNYFCQMLLSASNIGSDVPYQVQVGVEGKNKDKMIKMLETTKGVDDYYGINSSSTEVREGSTDYVSNLTNDNFLTASYKNLFKGNCDVYLNMLDDDKFNELCKKNNIDYTDYYGKNLKAILMNNISHKSDSNKVFEDSIIGETINLGYIGSFTVSAQIKYDDSFFACKLNPQSTISFYVPYSAYCNLNDSYDKENMIYTVGIETKSHSNVAESIRNNLEKGDYGNAVVIDVAEQMQTMNAVVYIMEVLVYGFVGLITLITIANIVNTISTGIISRRKEFAMLKSVGVTPKGFNKMIMLESALYGIRALIFAVPISILISFLMNQSISSRTLPFIINWQLYLMVIGFVFAIIFMTMIYSVRKASKNTIVETLKEDIV